MISPKGRYADVAQVYDESFALLCGETIGQLLAPLEPASLLDVGAGTGRLTQAAQAAGHRVVAVEPDRDMGAVCAARNPLVPCVQAHLPLLPFASRSFDHVVANFVINHVADPLASMRELLRVTRDGGRVSVSIWRSGPSGMGELFDSVATRAGAVWPPLPRLPAERDFERTVDGLAGLMDRAGLSAVVARDHAWTWRVAPTAFWRAPAAGLAVVGTVYRAQSAEIRTLMDDAYAELYPSWCEDGVLALPATAVIATGIR